MRVLQEVLGKRNKCISSQEFLNSTYSFCIIHMSCLIHLSPSATRMFKEGMEAVFCACSHLGTETVLLGAKHSALTIACLHDCFLSATSFLRNLKSMETETSLKIPFPDDDNICNSPCNIFSGLHWATALPWVATDISREHVPVEGNEGRGCDVKRTWHLHQAGEGGWLHKLELSTLLPVNPRGLQCVV